MSILMSESMLEIRERARRLLLANIRRGTVPTRDGEREFVYVCPSPAVYHHQWLWDSCFHAIVMARFDGALAQAELRTLLSQMQDDGFLPHLTNWVGAGRLPLLRRISRWLFGQGHHRRLTQPPVLGIALEEVHRHTGDDEFLRQMLPPVKRYYQHLAASRDPDDDGLLSIIFPIESGMDHSPVYDAALGLHAPGALAYHIANIRLFVNCLRHGWDMARILIADHFAVEDVGFNSLYAAGLRAVTRLASYLDDPEADSFARRAAQVEAAILSRCYDAEHGLFYSLLGRREAPLRVKTIASLLPLVLESLPAAQASNLVAHLRHPASFAAPYPVPSVAQDEPSFAPTAATLRVSDGLLGRLRREYAKYQLVWRGPSWVNTNWFITRGLRQHGYGELADEITLKTAEMVSAAGFWEYYHPFTGEGLGAEHFSWSTLVVDMLDAMQNRQAGLLFPPSGSTSLAAPSTL
jgi:glycogen debranching enzyme